MHSISGHYYPPRSARRIQGELRLLADGTIEVVAEGLSIPVAIADTDVSAPLGGLPRVFTLPNESKFECPDDPTIDAWLEEHGVEVRQGVVHRLERKWRWVTLSLVFVVGVLLFLFFVGVPASAWWIAERVPASLRIQIGDETQKIVEAMLEGKSRVPWAKREELRRRFDQMAERFQTEDFSIRLRFREGGAIGANALAISNGTVMITDEMVMVARENDDAILGILAHEIGHLHHRHGLQGMIQASSLPLLLALVTGDLGNGASLLGAVPLTILKNGYSREHEREADAFARDLLRDFGIPTMPLAIVFEAFLETYGEGPAWMSSHPATRERIEFFEGD